MSSVKARREWDVLIIGAGINGIGTFRDLALQSLRVLMVDKGDYCSGASAASSHMVHGGIRYLENGELNLVRKAVQERNRLIKNAPHLVVPLPTVFPIFKWFSGLLNAPLKLLGLMDRPAERGAAVIKVGMLLYDLFSRGSDAVPGHRFRSREASLALFPDLNPEVLCTGTYYDGSMTSPERIAVELIKDAVQENDSAIPLNYCALKGIHEKKIVLVDKLSGEELEVQPRVIVNACGPWIDDVNRNFGLTTKYIGGTKGSHIVLHHPQLQHAMRGHEFFFENEDGRIVLIFPLEDRVLVGTSDIRAQSPEAVPISEEEVDYFISMIKRIFPEIHVDRSHIVFTYAGVRPLGYSEKASAGMISRDHSVELDELPIAPIYSLVGGKWTTFRALSEEVADLILNRLRLPRAVSTKSLGIGGGRQFPTDETGLEQLTSSISSGHDLTLDQAERLIAAYGTTVSKMLNVQGNRMRQPIKSLPSVTEGEIRYLLEEEDICHLDDLIMRRTTLGKLGKVTRQSLNELAQIAGPTLGWSDDQVEHEIERVISLLRDRHRVEDGRYLIQAHSSSRIARAQPAASD